MAKTPARKTPSRGAASKAAVGRIEEIARNLPASHWTVNGLVARTNDGAVFVIPLNQLEQFRVRDLESGAARIELTRFFQDFIATSFIRDREANRRSDEMRWFPVISDDS